jgi:hypothetical protein
VKKWKIFVIGLGIASLSLMLLTEPGYGGVFFGVGLMALAMGDF